MQRKRSISTDIYRSNSSPLRRMERSALLHHPESRIGIKKRFKYFDNTTDMNCGKNAENQYV